MSSRLAIILSLVAISFQIVGLVASAHVIMKGRTSQGTIAWVLSLMVLPYLAVPIYLVLGRTKFLGYNTRKSRTTLKKSAFYNYVVNHKADNNQLSPCVEQLNKLLIKTVGSPFLSKNKVDILIDGKETFDAILKGIASAKNYILVQYFIVKNDEIGNIFKQALIDKARAGVQVFFVYDEVGCHKLSKYYLRQLVDAGVQVTGFKATRGLINQFQINFRNHRKIVIVDGLYAFLGGLNVGEEYLGHSPEFGHWRDTHLALAGPAVQLVQTSYARDWYWATQNLPEWNWSPKFAGNHIVNILPTGPTNSLETCSLFVIEAITTAKKRIWITSPYFVPDLDIVSALKLAALRGVDVRIMLPNKADHKLVYLAAFSYLEEAENAGVKIYRYQKGFLHQKVILVDDEFAGIGTVNLDNRSLKINFEITLICSSADFVSKVDKMLIIDFNNSVLVTSNEYNVRNVFFKIAVRSARLLSPIL